TKDAAVLGHRLARPPYLLGHRFVRLSAEQCLFGFGPWLGGNRVGIADVQAHAFEDYGFDGAVELPGQFLIAFGPEQLFLSPGPGPKFVSMFENAQGPAALG